MTFVAERRAQYRARRRTWIAVGVGLVIVLLGGARWLSNAKSEGPAVAQASPSLTVTAVAPRRVVWPDSLTASGVIAPWAEASVGVQIGSYQLLEVRADVGDQVKRGQVLARLNTALLLAEEAQLVAQNEQSQANNRRALKLRESGAMSEQEALRLGTEAKAAAARLAAKQLELRYTAITAPDDGVITSRTATLGAVVPAGQELFRLIRGNRLEWRGELTASQLQTVSLGQTIDLVLPDGSPARATVRQTSPALSDQTRLAVVYADLVPGSHARAGMYASGKIAIGEAAALTVPAECIVVRDGRNYVMELEGAGSTATVRRRAVTVGRRKDEAIEILSGLSGRERLVPRGAGFLDDGDEVRVVGGRWAPA